jgi:hypothetical protein
MWGTSIFYNVATLPEANTDYIPVPMIRALARIEVGIDIDNPAGGDPAIGFGKIFAIDSVYLVNVNDSGYVSPNGKITAKKDTVGYSFVPDAGRAMRRTIYAPETDSLILAPNGETVEHAPPFLVLKATYYGTPYYYRVDFTKNNEYKPLLRNHAYTVNITGIRTVGYQTREEAFKAPILSLNPNLVIGDNEETATINDIVYSSHYWLGCQSTDVKLAWDVIAADIKISTSYPGGGWKAELLPGSDFGMTALLSQNKLHMTVSRNETGQPRKARIKLTAGTLTQYINVTQSLSPHTFIARTGEPLTIPLPVSTDGIQYFYSGDTGENALSVSFDPGDTEVTIPASVFTGPGVIHFTGKMGVDIVWAYTVWVTGNTVDFTQPANQRHYNGYTFMDRNLGSDTPGDTGLYYQW